MPAHAAMLWQDGTGISGQASDKPPGTKPRGVGRLFQSAEYYGDLNDPGGVEVSNKSAVFYLKPIHMVSRGCNKPELYSDYDVKMVILKGSTKTTHYRILPVTK
jgi:hypothetical protein